MISARCIYTTDFDVRQMHSSHESLMKEKEMVSETLSTNPLHIDVELSFTRERVCSLKALLVLDSAVILGSESSGLNFTYSDTSSTWRVRFLYLCPSVITPGTELPSRRLIRQIFEPSPLCQVIIKVVLRQKVIRQSVLVSAIHLTSGRVCSLQLLLVLASASSP
jgi:hypothetical protein